MIHVGANTGQERDQYASHGLNVLWIEPNPAVFEVLRSNISGFPKQKACCCLLASEHGAEYTFHISDNHGLSSSILDLAKHREIWPDTHFVNDIKITATTLCRLVDVERIDIRNFGALVLDTQGSELLVLKGAVPVLRDFQFVKTEVADFESYAGCCQLPELTEFMRQNGFALSRKDGHTFPRKAPLTDVQKEVGTYYEVLYRRV